MCSNDADADQIILILYILLYPEICKSCRLMCLELLVIAVGAPGLLGHDGYVFSLILDA